MSDKKSVVVVGGGWCGLYALKSFLEEGLDAVLYEKTDSIGKNSIAIATGLLASQKLYNLSDLCYV